MKNSVQADIVEFRLQRITDDNGKGAMSPVLFMNEMAKQMNFTYSHIYRVWFTNEEYHNVYEGKGKTGLTGSDTLIARDSSGDVYFMFVDLGSTGRPVALWFPSEPNDITVTPIYRRAQYERKLTDDDIVAIFKAVDDKRSKGE